MIRHIFGSGGDRTRPDVKEIETVRYPFAAI